MGKSNWASYNDGGEVIEITVRDFTGKKIDSWKLNCNDKKSQFKLGRLLKEKYGINFESSKGLDIKEENLFDF